MIVDFHSHVLPGMDDGSKDMKMSLAMLEASKEQGIQILVATPHFYATRMKADRFFYKRDKVYEDLSSKARSLGINLKVGAEVAFIKGISEWENLKEFTIKGTNLILIEMPFREWTLKDRDELIAIKDRGLQPVLAHVERFISYQKDKTAWDEILDMNLIYQFNCEDLLSFMRKGKVLKLIGMLDNVILGSDCHNVSTRGQNLKEGRAVISKKLGADTLESIDNYAASLLI